MKNMTLSYTINDRQTQKITKTFKNVKIIENFIAMKLKFGILIVSQSLSEHLQKYTHQYHNGGAANEHSVSGAKSS